MDYYPLFDNMNILVSEDIIHIFHAVFAFLSFFFPVLLILIYLSAVTYFNNYTRI